MRMPSSHGAAHKLGDTHKYLCAPTRIRLCKGVWCGSTMDDAHGPHSGESARACPSPVPANAPTQAMRLGARRGDAPTAPCLGEKRIRTERGAESPLLQGHTALSGHRG